jgi:hypothetical protein
MPPLHQHNLRKLVRKLGANSQLGEQAQALETISEMCDDVDFCEAIIGAGVIPLLVQLLGPASPAEAQEKAAHTLWSLAATADIKAAIASAGASPRLVQLLSPWRASPCHAREGLLQCSRRTGVPLDLDRQCSHNR